MTEKRIAVKLNIKNAKTATGMKDAITSVPGFLISNNGAHDYDIFILEIGHDLDEEFRIVEHIKATGPAREVFLTSSRNDPELLLKALKMGVKEFFPQPLNKEEVKASLVNFKKSMAAATPDLAREKKGVLITVLGSKGGVGATTTAVNVAVCIKQLAQTSSVALMDMKPFLGAIDLFLDIKTSFNWQHAAEDIERMDSTYLLNTLYKHESGIQVLTAPEKPSAFEPMNAETCERLIGIMRSAFDIVVLDGVNSFDDHALGMLALSDAIVLVSELNVPSVINTKKILDTFEGFGLSQGKDIRVVVNRYHKTNVISLDQAEKSLGSKVSLVLPNDYEATMSAINAGKPFSEAECRSPLREKFRELAALLLNKENEKKKSSLKSAFTMPWKTISHAAQKSTFVENFKIRAGLMPRRAAIKREEPI